MYVYICYVTIIKKLFNLIQSSSYPYAHQRKLVPKPRCKNLRKKAFNHLDSRKYVLARHLAEVNGTTAEESNTFNLIANAIDLPE